MNRKRSNSNSDPSKFKKRQEASESQRRRELHESLDENDFVLSDCVDSSHKDLSDYLDSLSAAAALVFILRKMTFICLIL